MITNNISQQRLVVASKIQEHFWALNQLNKLDTAYNIPSVYEISGNLDIGSLVKALNYIINKHEAFRTNFKYSDNQIFQVISDFPEQVDFIKYNINHQYSDKALPQEVISEIHKPFDLEKDKLMRVRVFEISEKQFFLTIVFHHIIIDLHSKEVFSKELSEIYNKYYAGKQIENNNQLNQYSNFSELQNIWLLSPESAKQLNDWSSEVHEIDFSMDLPYDLAENKGNKSQSGKRKYFKLDAVISQKAKMFCHENTLNLFNVLLSAYFTVVHRISNLEQISIGVPFTNRRNEEYKDTIGSFVNILPIIVKFDDDPTFHEITKRLRVSMLKAHRKQETPFLLINSLIEKGKSLFNIGFTFEHPMHIEFDDIVVINKIIERKGAQLNLFLTLWEEQNEIQGFIEYSNHLFSKDFINHLLKIFYTTLENVLQFPQVKISQINITPLEDINFIHELNKTETDYEDQVCVHEKLELQASKTPFSPALLFKSHEINYDDLNKHSNSLAHYLISRNVVVEDIISICCFRSIEMMVGIFGILKAGAAYLPVNPHDPKERIEDIVKDAKPKYILTTREASKNLDSIENLIFLDEILNKPFSNNFSNPNVNVTSRNLAYIIYTSGSTGTPKGVMIEHHSVLNRLLWMQKNYPIDASDTLIQKTPITFDVSVWELFWWTFSGAKLFILQPEAEKDPNIIIDAINKNSITTIHFVPTMFSAFLEVLKADKHLSSKALKKIFLSGEALTAKMVNEFNSLENLSGRLINLYGPTEATVDVSYYDCPVTKVTDVFIGKPIDNTQLYIVDSNYKILPVGIPGELLIAGVNLSRGYLKRDDLNREKFLKLNLPNNTEVRAYRTGDLCKLCPNGEIQYLGRIDNMIKIRGFRVELGEIESKILEIPEVAHCAVIVNGEGENKVLVAYVHLNKKESLFERDIKIYLKSKLPEYMVPALYEIMDSFPLTSSGKLNRKALPKPKIYTKEVSTEIPNSKKEAVILEIWERLLGIKNISICDNFFDLGGNSLLAIRLSLEINKVLNLSITPIDILNYPSIRSFYCFLEQKQDLNSASDHEKRALQSKQNLLRLRNTRK